MLIAYIQSGQKKISLKKQKYFWGKKIFGTNLLENWILPPTPIKKKKSFKKKSLAQKFSKCWEIFYDCKHLFFFRYTPTGGGFAAATDQCTAGTCARGPSGRKGWGFRVNDCMYVI